MRNIVRFEQAGTTYIGYDSAGRAVGIVTDIKRNVYARDSKKGLQRIAERVER